MDIKGKIEEIADKVKSDKDFAARFTKDPVKAVEGLIGIDLPDDKIKALVEGIKAKVSLDKADGLLGSVKRLF